MFAPPFKTASLMRAFEHFWCIAGGWAIDLFLERETRPHADIEIVVFRRDQMALQKYLRGWTLKKAAGGALTDWEPGEFLELPVHEIHCFSEASDPARLEVLLNENDERGWFFRRNRTIARPLAEISLTSSSGIRFLSPEIVLLYKSKNPREKDELDFEAIASRLDPKSRNWLLDALSISFSEHRWLNRLGRF